MSEVRLPALTGSSPLGLLAAMGVLRVLTEFSDDAPRLRWDRVGLTAVLCSRRASVGQVVEDLQRIVAEIPEGSVLPGIPAGFPPKKVGSQGADPMRKGQDHRRARTEQLASMSPAERDEAQRWLASLVTDLVQDTFRKGQGTDRKMGVSLYTAPAAQQTMATMLTKPLEAVQRNPDYILQALQQWRRVAGVTGEYLDHRAMWDATQDGGARSGMRGVPGATWLALMSLPMLRTTGSGSGRPASSGWHTVAHGRRHVDELRLPVWEQPLRPASVVALIEHPALAPPRRPSGSAASLERFHERELRALGVIHVCRARRSPGLKSDGVLTTVTS